MRGFPPRRASEMLEAMPMPWIDQLLLAAGGSSVTPFFGMLAMVLVLAVFVSLALVKMRSGLYDAMSSIFGIGKVNLLACFALFDDNPAKINTLETEFKKVTPELIRKTAQKYLSPNNRTILIIQPKASNS